MKFLISSKYFYDKILEILMKEADQLIFEKGVLFVFNEYENMKVFISIEKTGDFQDLKLKIDNSALYKLLNFLDLLREQPIVVEIGDLGNDYVASFRITQTVANF